MGGMDRPSSTESHTAGSLSSSQPAPCWASPLTCGLITLNRLNTKRVTNKIFQLSLHAQILLWIKSYFVCYFFLCVTAVAKFLVPDWAYGGIKSTMPVSALSPQSGTQDGPQISLPLPIFCVYVDIFSWCQDQMIIEIINFTLAKSTLTLCINLQISRNKLHIPSCWCKSYQVNQRGLNTRRPTIVFFLELTKPLPSYIRQARTRDTVLVKSRETTGIGSKTCRGGFGEKG